MIITATAIFLMGFSLCLTSHSTLNQNQVTLGQSKYTELSQSSSLPRYGPCWLSALRQLETKCDQLTEESHSRLALQFANCQLAQSGRPSFPCGPEESLAACLEKVDTNAWTSYTNFYSHTHNMCYFLKSQQWQEETDLTIDKLSQSSSLAVEKLEKSQQLQQEIAGSQRDSLEYQRQLVENGSYLSQAIEASRGGVQEMMEEFKMSTMEQRTMIFEVFDRVSRLQNLVVSEVSWLYTVVFYCFSLLVIYLVTATKRTADARLWLFLLLTVNFGVERAVIKLSLTSEEVELGELVSRRVWMVRNTSVLLSLLNLAVMAVRFKDYNLINNQLLEEIRKQNLELKRSMENYQADSRDKYNLGSYRRQFVDSHDGQSQQPQHHLSPDILAMLGEDTGYRGDEEDEEFSDSDDSFNSTRSDRTFEPEDFNFSTAAGSRETTPTPQNDINLAMEEINSSLVSSTSTPVKKIPQLSDSRLETSLRYNLRSRSRASNSSVTSNMSRLSSASPVIKSSQVKTLSSTQKRNQNKLKMLQAREEFSADES